MTAWVPWLGCAGGAALAGAGLLAHAVRSPSSTLLAPSVHRGTRTRRAIALTFDDGPSESTPELLAILARYGVPATFFQCGANVRRLPEVARAVAAPDTRSATTPTRIRVWISSRATSSGAKLSLAQETIERATGVRPRYFRAPYGIRWFGLREAQQQLGLMGVMWTSIALDWKWTSERIVPRLLNGAQNGAILCLHDGRTVQSNPDIRATLESVREVLPKLMQLGFHFEKVTDILCPTKS